MKCEEVRERLGDYWDLPEGDIVRTHIDDHVTGCPSCAEEFEVWRESALLIQSAAKEDEPAYLPRSSVSSSVMDRIYAEESWRKPISERMYSIPYRLRIRLMTLFAACLAMFGCGFLYQMAFPEQTATTYQPTYGVMNVSALGSAESSELAIAGIEGVPIASIGDPVILGLPMVDSYPDYLLAMSLLGLIGVLLIMNWFSRIRA